MLDAIRLLASGWMIYPAFKQEETPHGGNLIAPRENGASPRLTPRQEQVLKCLATGMPNKTIALQHKMSERTEKANIQEIIQRLRAAHRTQVVGLLRSEKRRDGQGCDEKYRSRRAPCKKKKK